jgi:ribosomal protein L37AE/L43A
MIRVDPALAFGAFFAISLLGAFMIWQISWSERRKKGDAVEGEASSRRCPYCGHSFIEYLAKDVTICPMCKSYLEGGPYVQEND